MSSSADICQKIEAARAKREQDRLAAEAKEAAMLKEMEERLEEEKWMEEVRIAMEIEKRESERNQRQIQKEKWRAEKRRRQEEEDVPVVVKRVRRNGEVEDEPQAEASGSGTGACCQGTSLAVCTPFIYPIYCSYSTFISLCLHICLLLFGYDLTLSCSQ